MSTPVEVESMDVLRPELEPAVRALIAEATDADGVPPISEHQLLRIGSVNPDGRWSHVVARSGGDVLGYAIVDRPADGGAEAELVVHPLHRGAGTGTRLLREVIARVPGRTPVMIWAHGNSAAARGFAEAHRLVAERTLWQLRRPLGPKLPEVRLPDHVRLRAFDPTADGPGWVEVNAAAFADHPEQGSWTLADLQAREGEEWFDPDGFLIAEFAGAAAGRREGDLAGFHWTKVHGPTTAQLAADPSLAADALGEVYVVGVSPAAQGGGLGKALTLAGLHHLRQRGIPTVLLYVDDDNAPAMALYRRLGFTEHAVDVQYRLYQPQ